MSPQLKRKFYLLAISLLPMALMAIYVQKRLPITDPSLNYCILSDQQSVTWSMVPSHFAMIPNPNGISQSIQLDLNTGVQTKLPFAFFQVLDRSPDGTVTIQQFKMPGPGIEIAQWSPNTKSSRTLWRVDRLLPVLNHRYLLSSQANRIVAYDLHASSQLPAAIDVCIDPLRVLVDDLQCIDGTNNLLVSRTVAPNCVAVYSLDEGKAAEIVNWSTGGQAARAVIRQGRVYSLSQDGLWLEVRDSQKFEVVDRLRIPGNMIEQWDTAICGQALVTIQHPQTSAYETYRLRDLSPIPELNNWAPYRFRNGEISRQRYHVFNPTDGSRRKLLIYDSLSDKIVLEHDTGYDYVEVGTVGDDKLAIIDYRGGFTCKVIDLKTGSLVATHRPLFWPLMCTLALNVAVIVWAICWLRFSVQAGLSIVVDWFVLGTLIAVPMLYRSWTFTWMTMHPSMNLFHACWLVCMLAAGYNVWFGDRRIVFRICICLIILAASAGMLQLREWVQRTSSVTTITTYWLHFLSITLLSIGAMRVVTLPWFGAIDQHQTVSKNALSVRLGDLFVLTAVAALLIGSILPINAHFRTALNVLLNHSWPFTAVASVTMTVASGLYLSRWRIAVGIRFLMVGVAMLIVIGEWALKLTDFKFPPTLAAFTYSEELLSLASFCFLIAAAWAWRLKSSHCLRTPHH